MAGSIKQERKKRREEIDERIGGKLGLSIGKKRKNL